MQKNSSAYLYNSIRMVDEKYDVYKDARSSFLDVKDNIFQSKNESFPRRCSTIVPPSPDIEPCKVYKRRWAILVIFVFYSASNSMQWIQYSIITDVVVNYYQVPTSAVNLTSMVYMILYIPFIFPASYIIDKLGLRFSVLIGIIGTCAGSWIKVCSASPDRFWVGLLGQSVVALSQVFILSVPARLAAVWFGPEQVSSACAIGVFGSQLGAGIGFLLPPMIVTGDEETITDDLFIMFISVAVFTSVLLVLILLFFKDAPPTPPSFASKKEVEEENKNFFLSLKNLLFNKSYVFLLIAYGINVGIFYAISTLLNQIILTYYPNAAADAGMIGLLFVFAGMIGSVICGVVLDKWRKFKETTLVVYVFSLVSMIIYTFTLDKGIIVAYIVFFALGFFMTGLLPVGFELGAELTYPEPEGTSAGLLNASSQVFGITFTIMYSIILDSIGEFWATAMSAMLVVGTIFTALISNKNKRQEALVVKDTKKETGTDRREIEKV